MSDLRTAALAQQADPVEPVAWVASKDGRVIYDDASTDDGLLRVSGDFENDEQRISYEKQIVDKLNAASAQQKDPTDPGHDVDVLREHVRHLERRVRQLHAQQAEPVDPVAWRSENANPPGGYVIFQQYPQALADLGKPIQPLYTAPPQRKLVPLTIERLRDALVASRIIDPAAVEDPDEYDDGVTLHRIEALHRRIT